MTRPADNQGRGLFHGEGDRGRAAVAGPADNQGRGLFRGAMGPAQGRTPAGRFRRRPGGRGSAQRSHDRGHSLRRHATGPGEIRNVPAP